MIRCVLFDLDGTLIDTLNLYVRAAVQARYFDDDVSAPKPDCEGLVKAMSNRSLCRCGSSR